jgi:hypothetical protein
MSTTTLLLDIALGWFALSCLVGPIVGAILGGKR